jgi:hypothetical protein
LVYCSCPEKIGFVSSSYTALAVCGTDHDRKRSRNSRWAPSDRIRCRAGTCRADRIEDTLELP